MTKTDKWHYWALAAIIALSFMVMVVRLLDLQVRGQDDYGAIAESSMTKTIYESGMRGQILDKDGALLAYDKQIYNVEFYRDPSSKGDQNALYSKSIWEIIQLLKAEGKEVKFDFWLQRDENGAWAFNFNTTDAGVIAAREKMFRSNFYINTTPLEEIYDKLCANYRINEIDEEFPANEKLTEADKLQVLSVWQEMQMNAFNSVPITLGKDIKWSTVIEIETRMVSLDGISISVQNQRVYPKGPLACHIVGYTGLMQSKTQTEEYLQKGYQRNDTVGLAGIENSMEQWLTANSSLRRGYSVVEIDRSGRKIRQLDREEPVDGNTVKLTIDSELQQVVETELAKIINDIRDYEEKLITKGDWLEANKEELEKYAANEQDIKFAETGAIVVLDMNARVLAMASYPNFDPNDFILGMDEERYIRTMKDERKPLYNNAIMARDTPGSVFKMATALAGLYYGELTVTEEIPDMGPFTLYDPTNPPKCWIAPRLVYKHQDHQTVVQGIAHSCNYFFYTVASRLGDDGERLYQFASKLGLASKTNINLPGESKSVVGSQISLYDPSRPITEAAQDTATPVLYKAQIKKHLKEIGEEYGITYSEERLDKCIKALMDMAVVTSQGNMSTNWVLHIRPILMEELGMTTEMVWRAPIVSPIATSLNGIKWGGSQTIQAAIGQSITLTTPVAMARYVVAIANGGYVYDVQLIDSIISPSGETINSFDQPILVNDLSAEIGQYLPYIKQGMHDVASAEEGGTAQAAFSGWEFVDDIGGKTGTAEISDIDIESNAWFVSFAPYENPEIVVVIYVKHGLGGSRTAPAARAIIDYYLKSRVAVSSLVLPAPNALAQ